MPAPPIELAASISRWGAEYGVPISLLEALTWHESRWRPDAVSEAGAIGVGQLMPATAAALEATIGEDLDPWVADHNVRMAAHLLGTLLITSGGDPSVALAGYAQGAASVQRHGMTATTAQYVDEIMTLFDQFTRVHDALP
jgi:N-acetylmuramoyl-L-alanine amidase